MSNYPQYLLTTAIAADGDKVVPPADSQTAGTGRLSQEKGWTEVNSMPISEGGIPPKREDFNGALYLLSQFLVWYQQGGVMAYKASLDYEPTNEVFVGSTKYRCIQANGPSSIVVAPNAANGAQYWKTQDSGDVRWDQAQSLTAEQQAQARTNINVETPEQTAAKLADAIKGFVAFDKAQSLTEEQQLQARTNIGAIQSTDISGFVSFAVAQALTTTQQKQARDNIACPSISEMTTAISSAVSGLGAISIAASGQDEDNASTYFWVKFSNGFIVQGGITKRVIQRENITFRQPFATDFYTGTANVYSMADGKRSVTIQSISRTNMDMGSGEGGKDPQSYRKTWLAVGF